MTRTSWTTNTRRKTTRSPEASGGRRRVAPPKPLRETSGDCQPAGKRASSLPTTTIRREERMGDLSRREHVQQIGALFGAATLPGWSAPAFAAQDDIPPEGIGKGIKHISYSDIGGRPDSVQ